MASFDMAMSGQTSQPKQKSYSKVLHTKRAIRGLICILFCLLSLLPFLLMVMNATRTSGDIQAGVSLIPSSHLMGELEHASSEAEWYEINIRKSNVELLMYHSTRYLPCSILFLYDSLWNSCI